MALRHRLRRDLEDWRDQVSRLSLPTRKANPGVRQYPSSFVSPEWYHAVFHNSILLLYRPSPCFPHHTSYTEDTNMDESLWYLATSAKAVLNIYSGIHRERKLNYSWITLHAVFMAGLSYIYSIGQALARCQVRGTPNANLPDYIEILEVTRSCSTILVAITEHCNIAQGSWSIFDKLSTALINEAVNVQFSVNSRQSNLMTPDGSGVREQPQSDSSTLSSIQQNRTQQLFNTSTLTGLPSSVMEEDELQCGIESFQDVFNDNIFSEFSANLEQPWFELDSFSGFNQPQASDVRPDNTGAGRQDTSLDGNGNGSIFDTW